MSQFYASINGSAKNEATRQGTKNTGISGHIRGWDIGVKVIGQHINGIDCFSIYMTSGSNDHSHNLKIGEVIQTPTGNEFKIY